MTLNASGPISLAGATTGQSIAVELGVGTTSQISLNCSNVRTLAGVASGAIVMPTNFWGKSATIPFSCASYTTAGTYTFTVPAGVTKICVVCVASGGYGADGDDNPGGGKAGARAGGLSYTNCIATTPGEALTVIVGAPNGGTIGNPGNGNPSSIARGATILVRARPGACNTTLGTGAVRYNGGNGQPGVGRLTPTPAIIGKGGGGGGAAGFAGNGGTGPNTSGTGAVAPGTSAAGGGGSGTTNYRAGGGGGGVGIIVQGATGTNGTNGGGGTGGSGGASGTSVTGFAGGPAGAYGGGGGGTACNDIGGAGGVGAVRIIYGGTSKTFPNNSAP